MDPIPAALPLGGDRSFRRKAPIRRMAAENRLWGQKRVQAELARSGFKVSARTVAKYMRLHSTRGPSPSWRKFLKRHASNIWAFRNGPVVVKAWTCRTLPFNSLRLPGL
jgi:hypothetical protein